MIIITIISAIVSFICFIALMSIWSDLGSVNKTLKDIRTLDIARDTRAGFAPTDKKGRLLK